MRAIKNTLIKLIRGEDKVSMSDRAMDEEKVVEQQYLLPVEGNRYWMIDAYGDVHKVTYRNNLLMNKMLHNCNLFPTKNDALEASFAAKNARIIVFNKLK